MGLTGLQKASKRASDVPLREIVAHLAENRAQLREEWVRRINDAQLLTAMTKDELFAEATSVYDSYVDALETRTLESLEAYAQNLSERIIPRGVETHEVVGIVLLLRGIRDPRARVVVIDITGVAAMDANVANHLVLTVEAARLLGASVIVTGLSPEIAQTLVNIGVDLGKMRTVGDLQGGIEEAERLLGYKVVPTQEAAAHPEIGRASCRERV